jgi:hypothetical protein
VLLILIPTAWLAALFFALAMCRLAAVSDDTYDALLAERFADAPVDSHGERVAIDRRRGVYRATG